MLTTLRLDDELCRQAEAKAAAQGISFTGLVERAIKEYLERPSTAPPKRRVNLPVSTSTGGLIPGASTLQGVVTAANLVDDRRQLCSDA